LCKFFQSFIRNQLKHAQIFLCLINLFWTIKLSTIEGLIRIGVKPQCPKGLASTCPMGILKFLIFHIINIQSWSMKYSMKHLKCVQFEKPSPHLKKGAVGSRVYKHGFKCNLSIQGEDFNKEKDPWLRWTYGAHK